LAYLSNVDFCSKENFMIGIETDMIKFSVGIVQPHRPSLDESDIGNLTEDDNQEAFPGQARTGCPTGHEWAVFSTALREGFLMVQCIECGMMGTVDDPTKGEWSEAYHAPSRPYRWDDWARVTVQGYGAPHVIRATEATRCDCHALRGQLEVGDYERYPGSIFPSQEVVDEAGMDVVSQLADYVGGTDLCSRLLPGFIRHIEEKTGPVHPPAVHSIIRWIEAWDSKGLHFSPGVVARILREFAAAG
jgi:hypothetical protein